MITPLQAVLPLIRSHLIGRAVMIMSITEGKVVSGTVKDIDMSNLQNIKFEFSEILGIDAMFVRKLTDGRHSITCNKDVMVVLGFEIQPNTHVGLVTKEGDESQINEINFYDGLNRYIRIYLIKK